MPIGRFRAGIGALLWSSSEDKYLLLRRSEEKDFASGVWECVTGRVDQGESFEDAVYREIREELDVEAQIDFIIGTTHFYRGDTTPENELLGVIYLCSIHEPDSISISIEHSDYRWMTAGEAYSFLSGTDPSTQWIRNVIERAEAIKAFLPGLIGFHQEHGFATSL